MTYIFIKHICVIPFRNQDNAAIMHMRMLMQVGPHKKIPLFPPLPPFFSMTYIFIEHIRVIPFRNQNNAAFMHMRMLMQVGPHKKIPLFSPLPPLFFNDIHIH